MFGLVSIGDERDRLMYAAEKFGQATYALTAGAGPIKERLREAYGYMHVVRESDVPEPLVGSLRVVRAHFALVMLPSRLRAMRTATAVGIARHILELSHRLQDLADVS